MTVPEGLYLEWRSRGGAVGMLRESRARHGAPPERWLQEIWAHQRLRRAELRTLDGHPLTVLHPGFWNHEAGPDFLQAVVQLGDQEPVSGDIEIDLASGNWKSHGHAGNAAYHNVVLHVVWESPANPTAATLPTLALRDALDAPVEELESWVGGAGDAPVESLAGHCAAPLRQLPAPALADILRQAAHARLQSKASLFRARARDAGWHQALWEGVFRALGYKQNGWAMQRLAELLPFARSHPLLTPDARNAWEARLLGLSGLLPSEPHAGTRARRLWDLWWRERETFDSRVLPAALWRLNGVRPANHPQRRLALASAWIADPEWETRLETWFRECSPGPDAERSLLTALGSATDGFWRRHYTLESRELPEAPPLLGTGRTNDLAVNAILPWLWARADAGADPAVRQRVENLYFEWPAGEDNATLKLARARLVGTDALPGRRTAAYQQGLLQIVRDFCSYSNAVCDQCRFPELVATLGAEAANPGSDPGPAPLT